MGFLHFLLCSAKHGHCSYTCQVCRAVRQCPARQGAGMPGDNMCAVFTQAGWGLRLCHLKLLVSNIRPRYSKLSREEHSSFCTPNPTSASAAANPFPLCFHPILVLQGSQASPVPNHKGLALVSLKDIFPIQAIPFGGWQLQVPVKDGAHASAVGAAAVHVQARGQQDPILDRHRAMGERGNEQLIPACKHRSAGHVRQSGQKSVPHGAAELVSPCWL